MNSASVLETEPTVKLYTMKGLTPEIKLTISTKRKYKMLILNILNNIEGNKFP